MRRTTVVRSCRVAVIVGTALIVINQLDVLIRGDRGLGMLAKVALTHSVPFVVATFSALAAVRKP